MVRVNYRSSYANRGMELEDLIKVANTIYQKTGIACVHKVPTEFKPIRDTRGKIVSCKVEEKSCVDYLGRYKNTPVAVEAKQEADKRISFSRVEPHQAQYLDDFTSYENAVGLVVVSFNMERYFAVPWIFWRTAMNEWKNHFGSKCPKVDIEAYGWKWTTPGMASVSAEQLLPDWEIKLDSTYGLPYLEIINKMRARGGMFKWY